jgi:tetratricopeptide (TPR) repeat protein
LDGRRLAAGGPDGVRMWQAEDGREVLKADGYYSTVALSPDGRRLAAGGPPTGVRVWEADGGREVWMDGLGCLGVSFSPDGRRLAASSAPGVRVWDTDSWREVWTASGTYLGVSFSRDGRRLAAGGLQEVRVWEADGGREVWKAVGTYPAVSFSPDRQLLAVVVGGYGLRLFGGSPEWRTVQNLRRRGIDASRTSWHEQRAATSATASDWFAEEFHRRWLIRIQPASGLARFRHGVSLARLDRQEDSKQEIVTALTLKASLPPLIAADCHAMLGQWKEAFELWSAEATSKPTNPQVWRRFAPLALVSGGRAGYRSACDRTVTQFAATKNSAAAKDAAWACAIAPDALRDMTQAVVLARFAVKAAPDTWNHHGVLGAVLYRTGGFEESAQELETAIRLHSKGGSPLIHVFLAMAQHRLGKADEAAKSLAAAEKLLDSNPAWHWIDRLERQLLRDEATALIRGR